jgi:hypothetical protein
MKEKFRPLYGLIVYEQAQSNLNKAINSLYYAGLGSIPHDKEQYMWENITKLTWKQRKKLFKNSLNIIEQTLTILKGSEKYYRNKERCDKRKHKKICKEIGKYLLGEK